MLKRNRPMVVELVFVLSLTFVFVLLSFTFKGCTKVDDEASLGEQVKLAYVEPQDTLWSVRVEKVGDTYEPQDTTWIYYMNNDTVKFERELALLAPNIPLVKDSSRLYKFPNITCSVIKGMDTTRYDAEFTKIVNMEKEVTVHIEFLKKLRE